MASGTAKPKKFIGAVEDAWTLYSNRATDYTIGLPVGFGASSTVYAAVYHAPEGPINCALKVLDLDKLPPNSMELLKRETTLMSLSKHPNVLRVRGSWLEAHKLYIALRLMNKGSAADVMRYGWPGGMDEEIIRCILKQALEGLNYLHINGFIHRDVKAANLLIDEDGTVLLGDLGVAADLTDEKRTALSTGEPESSSSRVSTEHAIRAVTRPKMYKRKSFVGTPCWMSPELIQGQHYDSSSDIWSFGITALELTQGRPPRSRESPQNILLRTVQEAPPTLDREGGDYQYSKAFKEVVESCLVKDPSKRPTAAQLLQTHFFKGSKKKGYLVGALLHDLPPLTSRQERRKQPSISTNASIASWDFTRSTPTSPTSRRQISQSFSDPDDHFDHPHSPLGDGAKSYLVRGGYRHGGHSKNVSWAGSSVDDHHESVIAHGIAIPEELSTSLPRDGIQAAVSSSGDSSGGASSPASSVPEINPAAAKVMETRVREATPDSRGNDVPVASGPIDIPRPTTPASSASVSPMASNESTTSAPSSSSLWRKLAKGANLRPSSKEYPETSSGGMRATMGATLTRALSINDSRLRGKISEPTPSAPALQEARRTKSSVGSLLRSVKGIKPP